MLEHSVTLELIKKAQAGDEKAKEILLTENMPLIKSLVKKYLGKNVEYEDLIELGSIGLLKAVENFDTSFEVRFSTYAVPMISGEIKRFIRDDGAIKVSRSIKYMNQQINLFVEKYRNEHGAEPKIKEIAKEFSISEEETVMIMDSSQLPVSIYDPCDESGNLTIMDKISDGSTTDNLVDKIVLRKLIDELPEKEKKVLFLRYFRDKTQSEIASIMGVSQVQISRIEAKIINKMREEFLD